MEESLNSALSAVIDPAERKKLENASLQAIRATQIKSIADETTYQQNLITFDEKARLYTQSVALLEKAEAVAAGSPSPENKQGVEDALVAKASSLTTALTAKSTALQSS